VTNELQAMFKRFEEKVGTDWVSTLGDITTTQQLIKEVAAYGITLSEAQAQEVLNFMKTTDKELSEKELSGIAGGTDPTMNTTSRPRRGMDP